MRRIIHIDMDCFYAAVEMRERPEIAHRPIAVGGSSGRGVLTTCNYEARRFGIRSAMPVFQAKQRCPHLTVLPVRFELYREVSRQIREIMHTFTELVEPLSLDEAYLDVTHLARPGAEVAAEIRANIYEATRLTASAGIAPNKLLAKIASDWNKPNGQFSIPPSAIPAFVKTLPIRKIWGIGPKSAEKMAALNVNTCGDLQAMAKADLIHEFGSFGLDLYHLCRGRDERPVQANRIRKSLSNERTYSHAFTSLSSCEAALERQFEELVEDLKTHAAERRIEKLFVKLKFSDFRRTTVESMDKQPNWKTYLALLRTAWGRSGESVRLVGLGVRFAEAHRGPEQMELALFPSESSAREW